MKDHADHQPYPQRSRNGWRSSRAMTGVVLLAATTAMTACAFGSSGGPSPGVTSPSAGSGSPVADPNAVLDRLAAELRRRVDTLVAPIKATQTWKTGDSAGVCGIPSHEDWPQQWNYGLTFQLDTADTRPLARQLAEQLHRDGWTLRDDSTSARTMLVAQQAGTVIQVQGLSTEGSFSVQAFTACVRADGTVDHSPVT